MSYKFCNGTIGYVIFEENGISSYNPSKKLVEALVRRADYQLRLKKMLTAYESAEYIKNITGLNYEVI